jgi:hypothetical protein
VQQTAYRRPRLTSALWVALVLVVCAASWTLLAMLIAYLVD